MSATPRQTEDIEREIEATREELSRTLDALQSKLSVRRRIDEVKDVALERGSAIAAAAVRTVKTYPVPLMILAVPVVWMLFRRDRTR